MGWGIEEVIDRIMVGGGYSRENGENAAVARASVSAIATVEEKVWNGYGDVSGRSFFVLAGAEATCADNGHCRLGIETGVGFVPGILGAFAGPKLGASYQFGDGHTKAHLGFELAVLDPVSPLTEMWALEARVIGDLNDKSIGFGVFLSVGGSALMAVKHRE